jgi:hypothetical protein
MATVKLRNTPTKHNKMDRPNEIRNRRSKKDRQHNGQKKKMKRQTTVKKTKDWSTRTLPNKNDNKTENNPMINQEKGRPCDYDKREKYMVICDTDSKLQLN